MPRHIDVAMGVTTPTTATPEVRRSARLLVIGAAVLVAIAVAPIAVGLASALVLYELFAGPYARLARRVPTRLAAAPTVCAALLVVVGPMAWIGFQIEGRVPSVVAAVSVFCDHHSGTSRAWASTERP